MIKVEVEDYCQQCPDFESEVDKPPKVYSGNGHYTYIGDTIIRCVYRHRCKSIENHIKNTDKKE